MNHWDSRYSADTYFYGTEPNDFLRAHAARVPTNGRVLCLAEGEGRNAVFLAELGFDVTAVDLSPVGLDKARRLAASRGVSIHTTIADLTTYEIQPDTWDAIVSIWCHLPPADRAILNAKCLRGLKPGGVLILEAYHPSQVERKTGGPPDPTLLPTLAELSQEFAALETDFALETLREVSEGTTHKGMSAVVQFVGRRRQ